MIKNVSRLSRSRYAWFFHGLPVFRRARAMYLVRNYTMTSPARAKSLWDFCEQTLCEGVEGDFVECGVWKGGSSALMAMALRAHDPSGARKLYMFDSFEGLPQPLPEDGIDAATYSGGVSSGKLESVHQCEADLSSVEQLIFGTLELSRQRVTMIKGWFQDTVPAMTSEPAKIAILRLDGDWYESTKVCLDSFYDRVSPGGVIILDDYYCWEGCMKAADEFRDLHNIKEVIHRIDVDCGYWVKRES